MYAMCQFFYMKRLIFSVCGPTGHTLIARSGLQAIPKQSFGGWDQQAT
jgi:hypothetical protein